MVANYVDFTVANGATNSSNPEWENPDSSLGPTRFRLAALTTDANCPTTTLTISMQEPGDTTAKVVPNFSLDVQANAVYGADDLAALASCFRFNWRLTLGTAPSADSVFKLWIT